MAPSCHILKNFCHVVFWSIVFHQAYVRYERYNRCERGPKLSGKKLMELLQAYGDELEHDKLHGRVGDIDIGNNGYDTDATICVFEHFDEIRFHKAAWKAVQTTHKTIVATVKAIRPSKMRSHMDAAYLATLKAVNTTHKATLEAMVMNWKTAIKAWTEDRNMQSQTLHFFWDIFYLVPWYVSALMFLSDWQALREKVAGALIFVSLTRFRMRMMKFQWEKLEKEKKDAESKTEELESQKEELKRTLESENVRTKKEEERLQEKLARVEKDLDCAKRIQKEKDDKMAKEVKTRARRSLESIAWMLESFEPSRGHGEGRFEKDGATTGFSLIVAGQELFGYLDKGGAKFFEVGESIGGGMDGAYKCHDLAKDFASRECHPGSTKEEQLCVKKYTISNERQRASMLRDLQAKHRIGKHKHIVRFLHAVETGEKIYVMMEFIPGRDILSFVQDKKRLSEKDAATIFHQLCQALTFCHDNGIVHCDVKPENAVVSETPEGPLAKLIDFGMASFLGTDENRQLVNDVLAAPEAFEKESSNTIRVDFFRLGCTLYIMLCGCFPFDVVKHVDGPRPCPDSYSKRKAGEVNKCGAYNNLSTFAKDLIGKMLKDRIDLKEAMSHKWVKLASMSQKQLKAEARKMEISEEEIEACDDAVDTKGALIKLLQNR